MELLLRRSQKSGLMGGVKFTLEARVELTQEEEANVRKYKMSDILLYEKGSEKIERATGTMSMLAARFTQLRVTVSDLIAGKSIEGKDIVDIMAAQDQIKEAVQSFKVILAAASTFDGEEVIQVG